MLASNRSQTELAFLVEGVELDVRSDGRGRLDYRDISLWTDVHAGANGSSRVVLADGATEVLAVIKAELGQPSYDRPEQGRLEVNVEVSPVAFHGRGPSNFALEDLNAELSQSFAQFLRTDALDWQAMCIIPNKICWVLYLDVLILRAEGNLLDAVSFAAYAAFKTCRIPKIDAVSGGMDTSDNPVEDFELSSDVMDAIDLPIQNLPICISLNRIGNYFVVDTSQEEECCVSGRVTLAVDESGNLCGVRKGAGGGFPARELQGITQHVVQTACGVIQRLKAALSLPPSSSTTSQAAPAAMDVSA